MLATLLRSGSPYRLRPTELFRSLMVTSGGMTDRLNRLVKAGHIIRKAAEGDGRSLLVELTKSDRDLAERAFRADVEIEKRLVTALSPQDQVELASLLRKLAGGLNDDQQQSPT